MFANYVRKSAKPTETPASVPVVRRHAVETRSRTAPDEEVQPAMPAHVGHDLSQVRTRTDDHVQRCGSTPPSECPCHDEPTAGSARTQAGIPVAVRARMEKQFGASFADVRVHADAGAAQRAAATGALAYTAGRDIYFGRGQYQPETARGQHLLAHELTHVVQQRNGAFNRGGGNSAADVWRMEQEAELMARRLHGGGPAAVRGNAVPGTAQHSLGPLEMVRAATGGINALVERAVAELVQLGDGLATQLVTLRERLRGMQRVLIDPALLAELEAIYLRLAAAAPAWLPVPAISFAAEPTQQAGPVAIPVAAVLLLIAFVLVMLWLMGNLNPAVRRQRERDVQRLIEIIQDGLRPRPVPVGPAEPDTTAPPVPAPVPPTVVPAPPTAVPVPPTDVPVPTTDAPPIPRAVPRTRTGNCTPLRHRELQNDVDWLCSRLPRACDESMDKGELKRNALRNEKCASARNKINTECFDGGDRGHRIAEEEARRAAERCWDMYRRR